MHNEPHSELEREALAAWSAQEPPPGFADRVLAADAGPKREPILTTPELLPRLGRRWSGVAAAALIAAAWSTPPPRTRADGDMAGASSC